MAYEENIKRLKTALDEADCVVVGAGAGLSTAAGLTYSGERFERYFADFIDRYHFSDMYSAGFYPFSTLEEQWAYWSRHIWYNRYVQPTKDTYAKLLQLVQDKDYFVLTTNVDHQFQQAGFSKSRLFYTQGDYGLWQCSVPCHDATYDNFETVKQMVDQQKDMRIPSELVPYCPNCGKPMAMNLRADHTFVEDEGWNEAAARYQRFLGRHDGLSVLFWELGVGGNTPGIIKFPFWRMTQENPRATYACINLGEAYVPQQIEGQCIAIDADIHTALQDLLALD